MKCVIREDDATTLSMFYRGFNDDLRREVMLWDVSTINKAYTFAKDNELLIKSQWVKR